MTLSDGGLITVVTDYFVKYMLIIPECKLEKGLAGGDAGGRGDMDKERGMRLIVALAGRYLTSRMIMLRQQNILCYDVNPSVAEW